MKNKLFNLMLFIVFILSISFFAFKANKFYQGPEESAYREDLRLSTSTQSFLALDSKLKMKDVSYYESLFRSKKLFKVLGKERNNLSQQKDILSVSLEEELSKFKLLGIISSAGRAKALIQNKKSGETFSCSGGEKINGFIVQEVLPNKVILKQGEVEAELNL